MANKTSEEIQIKDIDSWKRGLISYFSKSRLETDALKAAYDVIYDYDGIVRPRGSFSESDIPDLPEGYVPLGCDFPFKRADQSEGLINVFSDGDDAFIAVLSADFTEWEVFESFPLDPDAVVSMAQIAGVVVVGNGIDLFTYYSIADNQVAQFIEVDDPVGSLITTPVGFSGTAALDYYYKIALNGVGGTTEMSGASMETSSTLRDTWAGTKSVIVDISTLTIDSDALSWNVYMASVATGTGAPTDSEYLKIAENIPIATTQYQDTGELTFLQSAPVENTTAGILASYFKNISGRLWALAPDGSTVYWGGDVGNELYFGSANGSDSYIIDPESAQKPMAVTLGRDNSGTTCINLLTRTIAGQGSIWDVYATTNSITANGQTFSVGTYQFKEREGNDGTDAPHSVIRANNNAYYLSMVGFKSTGVKPNVSGIQSTDIISSAIRDRVLNLSQSNLDKSFSAYYDETLFWTVAYGAETNNEIWAYDMLHGGIWSIWRIPADAIFRWASTNSQSPSLYIRQGNKLLRYYKNSRSHSDLSGAFTSYIESGLIPFGDSKLEWVHILKNIWQFDQASGVINLTVNIHSAKGDIIKQTPVVFNSVSSSSEVGSGWDAIRVNNDGYVRGGWNHRAWNETLASLVESISASDKKVDQKIRKNAAYISFSIYVDTANTYYELSHLSMLYTYIGVGIEFLSQKGVIKI